MVLSYFLRDNCKSHEGLKVTDGVLRRTNLDLPLSARLCHVIPLGTKNIACCLPGSKVHRYSKDAESSTAVTSPALIGDLTNLCLFEFT